MRRYPDRGMHGRVVDGVGLRVVRGELTPGDTLDMDALAVEFDVSRTAIREALKVLAGKGLIDARPKRGTFVRERRAWNLIDPDVLRWQFEAFTDPSMLEKLAEIRAMVEPSAAALAARRRTEGDLAEMEAALADMERADPADESIVDADLRFHRALIAATHNELVEQLAVVIEVGLQARDRYVHGHRVSIKRGYEWHRDVAEAVRDQDAEGARNRMLALLDEATRDVRRLGGGRAAAGTAEGSAVDPAGAAGDPAGDPAPGGA
ncbi:FadR/GntR family transcriptional regulator [Streptosporangium pseudovulgare]|uniref:GntR family transcriptional regulator n=1 Tax=Streptosporangium pseudovulgare TaxID=35765 RepID=A0ABQ2R2C7_9ACTN|nr:FadR/GntR family transcriptional regulator [Streptosporangium pseudovulgare]GGQ10225.1 GntR family transcriptional regulator [Streptosporangium pseudovulgare]